VGVEVAVHIRRVVAQGAVPGSARPSIRRTPPVPVAAQIVEPATRVAVPPGRPVKPLEFVAPVFGEVQPPEVGCVAVLFILPPATLLDQTIPTNRVSIRVMILN